MTGVKEAILATISDWQTISFKQPVIAIYKQKTETTLSFLVVDKGLYTVHSFDVPYQQENTSLNFCWQAHNGDLALRAFCQVFQARIPGLYQAVEKKNETVSFESVCLPGYFMRQKNYHFILEKRDGSDLFGESVNTTY